MAERVKTPAENQSVARALTILSLLAEKSEPLGVREIARQLRLPPSIAQRLLKTLAKAGFLEQTGTTLRYAIGYKAFQVGNTFVAQSNLHSAVAPELYALADHHVSSFLGVMRDRKIVYLAAVQSNGPIAINHRPGAQTHIHSTAMGKALLAELPDQEIKALLTERPLPRLTTHTKTNVTQLMSELQTVRRQGYSTSDEENRAGFYSVGAVIRDATGTAIAVISGAIPTLGLKNPDRARLAKLVVESAQNASRRLGAPNMPFTSGASIRLVDSGSPKSQKYKSSRRRTRFASVS